MPLALDSEHHWLVPFAAVGLDGQRTDPPALPRLQALWPRLREVQRIGADAGAFDAPHERALALARGLPPDAPWPGAAVQSPSPHTPQAWVHPVHLQVGMDQVQLQAAELFGLDADASQRLFDALAPLCAEDGVQLQIDSPTRWRATGERLRHLRCASIDRVSGRSVAPWLPQGSEARWLQRLMSESQMLFYTHPVNDAREAARQLPVNSVWFSAAGAVDAAITPGPAPQVVDSLRLPALRGEAEGWRAAWQALDDDLIAQLQERERQGLPFALTLCGESAAATLVPHAPSPWRRLTSLLGAARVPGAHDFLKTL